MARRLQKTLGDYVAIAICPALIIVLLCSLVFFLIAVFYQGSYDGRLHAIAAFFVLGAVLIGRISIDQGREYAALYALPLGGVTMLAVVRFVEFGGSLAGISWLLNIGVLVAIWWWADKLTWDCTVIDERQDASGDGLLDVAGFDRAGNSEPTAAERESPTAGSADPIWKAWWKRHQENRQRPHAPGVWLIYFSLGSLIVFGVGGRLVPTDSLDQRRHVFVLLCVFIATALGLLLTTSFLGLRRYLRQRRIEMPINMAAVWIGAGVASIFAIMLFSLLLPRRNPEYSISQIDWASSSDELTPSRMSAGSEGTTSDDENASQVTQTNPEGDAPPSDDSSDSANSEHRSASSDGGNSSGGSSGQSGNGGQQDESRGDRQDSGQDSGEPSEATSGSSPDQSQTAGSDSNQLDSDSGSNQLDSDSGSNQLDSDSSSDADSNQLDSDTESDSDSKSDSNSEPSRSRDTASESHQPRASPPPRIPNTGTMLGALGKLMTFLYYMGFALLLGYLVWRYWDHVRAAINQFIEDLRRLWERLTGRQRAESTVLEASEPVAPPRPFADFPNPFSNGTVVEYSPDQLVAYTFSALEAWARERGCPREADQTAHEFTGAVARRNRTVAEPIRRLADLVAYVSFSSKSLPPAAANDLQRLWTCLEESQTATSSGVE